MLLTLQWKISKIPRDIHRTMQKFLFSSQTDRKIFSYNARKIKMFI